MKKITRQKTESRASSFRDFNEEFALVDVVVSTGAPVYREERDSDGEVVPFYRSLEISEDAIRMDRLLAGAPVLDNHNDGESVAKTLGSVHKAWVEGDKLMATLKISKITKEDKEVARKIKSGIITGVSVGAEIHSQKNVTKDDDDIINVIADDWEPYEISLVMIPADRQSIIRSKTTKDKLSRENTMRKKVKLSSKDLETLAKKIARALEETEEETEEQAMGDKEEEQALKETRQEDEEVVAEDKTEELNVPEEVEDAATEVAAEAADVLPSDLPAEVADEVEVAVTEAVEEVMESNTEEVMDEEMMEALSRSLTKRLMKTRRSKKLLKAPKIFRRKAMRISHDSSYEKKNIQEQRSMIEDSLATQISRGLYESKKKSGLERVSLVQLARITLERSGYKGVAAMTNANVYDELLSSKRRVLEYRSSAGGPIAVSSDFANLLTNAMTKSVMASYENMRGKQTFDPFVLRQTVDNFKDQERVQLGERADLKEVAPGADAEIAAMSDRKETYKVKTYSTIFQLTRQGFIDDDTGELQKVLGSGKAAADLESDLVYQQITSGTVDGQGLYVSSHRNSTSGANAALGHESYAGIKAIFKGLALQTGLNSDSPLHLTFGYLLVPVELNFAANQSKQVQYPSNIAEPNPYGALYKVIMEPRLDQNSTSTYYGLAKEASPAHPFLELGTISGAPIMKYEESFSNDVLKWKLTHDVGAKVLDYRLIYRVQGV